jgi:phospholipase/carboxylesterase
VAWNLAARNGRQWFSVQGVTEENRQQRIDAIMPTFIETVRYWQEQSGVGPRRPR